jgi:putative SOS response-associated peptidase YedK
MCGRFTLVADTEDFAESLPELQAEFSPGPRYNIAPTQDVATVLNDGRRAVVASRWGLVPHWAKDPDIGQRMINARAESLLEKPSFRTPLRKRRCLVLADGFYEWERVPGQRYKVPHLFRLVTRKIFGLAGLWDMWKDPVGEPLRTCTIITTTPNEAVAPIHTRMPVILPPEAYEAWLAPDEQPGEDLLPLLQPYPASAMEQYAVSTHVNKATVDDPECIRPAADR